MRFAWTMGWFNIYDSKQLGGREKGKKLFRGGGGVLTLALVLRRPRTKENENVLNAKNIQMSSTIDHGSTVRLAFENYTFEIFYVIQFVRSTFCL